jgi:uncharacterized protein
MGASGSQTYQILPFRFRRERRGRILLTNEVGEYTCLRAADFESFVRFSLEPHSSLFHDLMGKHFLAREEMDLAVDLLATKLRTKKRFLDDFTSLHMVVPTLTCNSRCIYCQASSRSAQGGDCSMSVETVRSVVATIFRSRSPSLKIEFQGGEPTMRFDIVQQVVEESVRVNRTFRKNLAFVLCTNLTYLTVDQLAFLRDHDFYISTSLDGPRALHDTNRPLADGTGSYDRVVRNIALTQRALGADRVSALLTVTSHNIDRLSEVIDEYRRRGLHSIFIRPLNPYGRAYRDGLHRAYSVDDFVAKYQAALDTIVAINRRGEYFVEEYAALLLERILTPFGGGFVDLQSPSGCAISGVIYNYDGNVYVADEGRMLAEMGDTRFLMGSVHKDTYEAMFAGPMVKELVQHS